LSGERSLRVRSGRNRLMGTPEGDEEAITSGPHLDPVVGEHGTADEPCVLYQNFVPAIGL
jgi:hypothetical protein